MFVFHFLIQVHSTNILYLGILMSKKGLKRKGIWGYTFPFLLIIFNISGWWVQGSHTSKTGHDSVPWLVVFLRVHLLFYFHNQSSPGRERKHASWGRSCFLIHRCNKFTMYWLWVLLNFYILQIVVGIMLRWLALWHMYPLSFPHLNTVEP